MHRFISSAASSSCGKPEQPPAPSQVQIVSIQDVQRWLAVETVASCNSADMERIKEAAAVLSRPKPRKEEVRPLQNKWQVAKKKDKKPRPLAEVLDEFRGKVIKAAQKLISLSALAWQRGGEKRENSGWSEDASPAKIAKCRSLTRYPTGDEIPPYSHSA